ncbi:MAG: DUF6055 domain-containing protein [Isosphaeraceae bacterium]
MVASRIRELIRPLDRRLDTPGGLFRLFYGLRNPPVGRGLGLDGVESEKLVHRYASALDRTCELFQKWGWPTPRRGSEGIVPVYVFRTERLGFGDCPLTFTGEVARRAYASRIALRSCFDEPRPEIRDQRASVEAAHEASHVFTHQFVPPIAAVGNLWRWFDEATAVFVESEVFPEYPESLRFGVYWNHCPEVPLTTWGGFGGYFAAWFVRYLVTTFGPEALLEVWRGADDRSGPLDVLERVLGARGSDLAEVFWEYVQRSYAFDEVAPGLGEAFGPRSITETFRGPTAEGRPDPLFPMACRYYRVAWGEDDPTQALEVHGEGSLDASELRGALLTVGADGRVTDRTPMVADPESLTILTASARHPGAGAHTAVVVARVRPPEPLATSTPATIQVALRPAEVEATRNESDLATGFDDPAARQSAFLGPRYATLQPREDDEPREAGATRRGPAERDESGSELPSNFRESAVSEYRRRRRSKP